MPAAPSPGPDRPDGIFQINEGDLPWSSYIDPGGALTAIRYKGLTSDAPDVPPVQYIEYGPGQTDAVHKHSTGELFIVTDGELWLHEARTGPGGVIYVPAHTDYSVRAGPEGARYFRVVVV
jgi:quercetin dioxygenase-like cupin family protein